MDRESVSNKNATITTILALFFGFLGAHRFYVGKYITGLLYFLFGGSTFVLRLLDELNLIEINSILVLFIGFGIVYVGIAFDLYALYSDSFDDKHKKAVLCNAHKDEMFGRTSDEKFDDKLNSLLAVCITIIIYVSYFVVTEVVIG